MRFVFLFCLSSMSMIFEPNYTFAQSKTLEAMQIISDFAEKNCVNVEQKGSVANEIYRGQVQAGISGFFKKLAEAGISGNVESNIQTYSGVLQSELSSTLNNVRDCKLNIIKMLYPILQQSFKVNDATTTRTLAHGSSQTPENPCTGYTSPEDLVLIMGTNAFLSSDAHHVVMGSDAGEIISISRDDDKKIGLNVFIVGVDGRLIAKIRNNLLETNNDNYLHIFNPSPSRKAIVGSDNKTYIDVEYINSQTIRLEGIVRFRNFVLNISKNELQLGDRAKPFMTLKNSCLAGNNVDIMVRQ